MTYFTPETLKSYLDEGLLSESVHPESPHIKIYNYTPRTQYSGHWDEVTLQCRGLILDTQREVVVARPFRKYFNYEQHVAQGLPLPDELPIISEKMDGALGILYWQRDMPWIATRGSFTSPHALWATAWLRAQLPKITKDGIEILRDPTVTHLFEIIAEVSRVVVAYDFEGLCYLATLDKATGNDRLLRHLFLCFVYPKILPLADCNLAEIQAHDEANAEGYVALYPQSGLRVKAKFSSYVRLHKILTQFSEKGIWEHLRSWGTVEALLEVVPDEMYPWIRKTTEELHGKFKIIEHMGACVSTEAKQYSTRKEQAAHITGSDFAHVKIAFQMLDGKDYRDTIWRMIEPKGARTFR